MESIHQILGYQVRPSDHVKWVSEHWHVDIAADSIKVGKDLSVDLHEDEFLAHVGFIKLASSSAF